MKKRYWIAGVIFALVVLIGGMYYEHVGHVREAEVSGVKVVKTSLDLYYVFYEHYPSNNKEFIEGLSDKKTYERTKQKPIDLTSLRSVMEKELKDFTYNVRGDQQAYKFSYTDQYGKKQEVEGNYQKDFH